jgi:lipopolysaccharide export LptBFGC system permease protein LptF
MGELIDLQAVEKWFGILAMLAPIAGIAIGAALQFRSRRSGALVTGLLIGALGPANWLLWHVYNRIEDHYGLDSVKAMLINLALFAALGIAVGLIYRFSRRPQRQPAGPERLNT